MPEDEELARIVQRYLDDAVVKAFIHEGTNDDRMTCLIWWTSEEEMPPDRLNQILARSDLAEMEHIIRSSARTLKPDQISSKIDRLYDHVASLVSQGTVTSNIEF